MRFCLLWANPLPRFDRRKICEAAGAKVGSSAASACPELAEETPAAPSAFLIGRVARATGRFLHLPRIQTRCHPDRSRGDSRAKGRSPCPLAQPETYKGVLITNSWHCQRPTSEPSSIGKPANPRRELISRPEMTPTGAGSFDFVRLRLHFAQDDKVGRIAMNERDNETSYFPASECTMSLNVRPRCS
jgi:hypothetical protein